MAGLLPWLHIKNLATTALFGMFAVLAGLARTAPATNQDVNRIMVGIRRCRRALPPGPRHVPRVPDWRRMALLLSGQAAMSWRRTPYLRVVEMLLGRHVDQSQGLFWHQPLFFPGLVALGWMVRRRHPLTLPWLLLYASLIVPPAVHGRWGGVPLGRFNWGAIWLWLIPIGLWLRAERATLERYVRPAVLGALAYQVDPGVPLGTGSDAPVQLRTSAVRLGARFSLPTTGPLRPPPLSISTPETVGGSCATWNTCRTSSG